MRKSRLLDLVTPTGKKAAEPAKMPATHPDIDRAHDLYVQFEKETGLTKVTFLNLIKHYLTQ